MTVFDVSKMGTFTQLLTVSSLLTQVSKWVNLRTTHSE